MSFIAVFTPHAYKKVQQVARFMPLAVPFLPLEANRPVPHAHAAADVDDFFVAHVL